MQNYFSRNVAARPLGSLALLLCAGLAGCGERPPEWRIYREVRPASTLMASPHAGASEAGAGALAWTKPEGWTEAKGSGMRLATFTMGSGSSTGTCTIIMLGGGAGGLEANVTRWLGQLGLAPLPEDELGAFLERQEHFETQAGSKGVAVNLTELAGAGKADAPSMIATVIPVDGATCFVKLTGSVGLIAAEKENFLSLCRSLNK